MKEGPVLAVEWLALSICEREVPGSNPAVTKTGWLKIGMSAKGNLKHS